jgi:phage tail tape-measure protein
MTMHRAGVVAVALAWTLCGCASSEPPRPGGGFAYPAKGQSTEQQARDGAECRDWAKQQSGFDPAVDTAKGAGVGAVIGAVGGAAVGAAIGAAAGNPGRGAAIGAVVGGVGGAAGGGAYNYSRNREGYDRAYANCMTGRGYTINH